MENNGEPSTKFMIVLYCKTGNVGVILIFLAIRQLNTIINKCRFTVYIYIYIYMAGQIHPIVIGFGAWIRLLLTKLGFMSFLYQLSKHTYSTGQCIIK